MNISLREVTTENFDDCVKLKVAESQKNFVGSNMKSIAESRVYPYLIPLAVYDDEELVGFTLHGKDPESKKYWLVRLMIGEKFQGKGYGKAATLKLIEKMSGYEDCDEVFLDFLPENTGAERLYEKVGFERTGETQDGGCIIMRYDMKNSNNRSMSSNN